MKFRYMRSCALCIILCLFLISIPFDSKAAGTDVSNEVTQSSMTKGVVKDVNGEPLYGVNVVAKGTTTGTITDLEGRFTIDARTGTGTVLVISYIGFKTQEITVGNRDLNIVLEEDSEKLDEVVVVGYGVQKKSDVTGSLSSVKGDELSKLSISRADQALQGKMAGVMIQNNVAAPGSNPNIIIRGGNSLKGNNDPLVVIDGVLGGNLSLVEPNDITSIEVLKDASATSIYGSRGANGVIMVTTKRGTVGKPAVSYSGYVSVSTVSRKMDMLNGEELYNVIKETQKYPNYALNLPNWFDPNHINNTDWQDEVFRKAPVTGHSLSVGGGTENTTYNVSGNYLMQKGIIKESDFNRAGVRTNLEQKIGKKFTIGTLINASRSSSSNISVNQMNGSDGGGITFAALGFGPLVPVYDAEGNYSGPLKSGAQMNNPVALLHEKTVDQTQNYFQGTAFAEWEIMKELRLRTAWTYTNDNKKNKEFVSGDVLLEAKGQGRAEIRDRETRGWLSENTLSYSKTFNNKHSVNAVAGFTAEETDYFNNTNTAKGFDIESLGYWNMGLADKNNLTIVTGGNHSAIASWLGRVNYAYMGKYLVSASIRADGSSKFAKNNKWGYFPSAAIGWRASEEGFIKDISWIHNLKLRASYGETGSQAISPYQSLSSFSTTTYVLNENPAVALIPGRVPNPNLKWETTKQTDIGLDFSLFGGRLDIVADYYYKKTVDLHYNKMLPYYTGYTTQTQNIGSKSNRGWEFSVNSQNITGAFKWSTSLNLSFNKDKVLELGDDTYFYADGSGGALGSDFKESTIIKVGESMGCFYGYVFDGIFQNQAEADALKSTTSRPGGVKLKDLDGDGEITPKDRTIIGNANPDFIFGIGNDFSYKNFDFSFLLQGTYGNDIMNLMKVYFSEAPGKGNNTGSSFSYVKDYWRGEGTSNTQQAVNESVGSVSSRFIEDGSYIRLKNITFGYTLPKSLLSKMHVTNMRLYLSGQNLFTITNYSGYDPEVSSRTRDSDPDSYNYVVGYDAGSYPSSRSFTFGLNVTF